MGHKSRSAPFGFTPDTTFVAHPAYIITHNGCHGFRLQSADGFQDGIPIINLLLAVGTFSIRTVKPNFVHFTVIGQKLGELFDKEFIVCGRIAITFGITIPWRQVNTKLDAVLVAGVAQLTDNVSFAILPRRIGHRMFGCLSRPKAETIMVLGRNNRHFETAFFQ